MEPSTEYGPVEYPATYVLADRCSQAHQTTYVFHKKLEYGAVLAAAVLSVVPQVKGATFNWPAFAGGVTLLAAAAVLFVEWRSKRQVGWYRCRALGEAVKAESWRFRSASPDSYSQDMSDADAVRLFVAFLGSVRGSLHVDDYLWADEVGAEVTQGMKESRRAPLADRVAAYRERRIVDQLKWYTGKAKSTKRLADRFVAATAAFLLTGSAVSLVQFLRVVPSSGVVGVFAAIAVTLFGWVQFRRYELLSITYGRAALELGSIAHLLDAATSERNLREAVDAAESVISKEHSIWYGRGEVA